MIDRIICLNEPVHYGPVPQFDAILFASSSAVSSLLDREDPVSLDQKAVLAIGKPTAQALAKRGISDVLTGNEALIDNLIKTFATKIIRDSLESFFYKGSY